MSDVQLDYEFDSRNPRNIGLSIFENNHYDNSLKTMTELAERLKALVSFPHVIDIEPRIRVLSGPRHKGRYGILMWITLTDISAEEARTALQAKGFNKGLPPCIF